MSLILQRYYERKAAKLERHIREIFAEIDMMTDTAARYAGEYARVMEKLRGTDRKPRYVGEMP